MRDYVIYGQRGYGYGAQSKVVPVSVSSMAVRILEREKSLAVKKLELRRILFKHRDYQKLKVFHEIGRGRTSISMSDLIYYLERNGFYPQTEDLEAILRRCDHDADRDISYEEFCELMELGPGDENDDQESIVHDTKGNMNSPDRKAMQDAVKQSQPLKRSNSNDKLDGEPKETMDEAMARKEEEQRIEELRQQRVLRYEAISQFISFVNYQLSGLLGIENQKKLFSYHSNFDAMELFRIIDKDNNGYLTEKELDEYFKDDVDFEPGVWSNLIAALNSSKDEGKLTYNDF